MNQKPLSVQITAAVGLILAMSIAAYFFATWRKPDASVPTSTPLTAYPGLVGEGESRKLTQQADIQDCGISFQYPDDWIQEKMVDGSTAFFSKEDNIALVERLKEGDAEGYSLSSLTPDTEDTYPTDYKSPNALLNIACSTDLKSLRAEYEGITELDQIREFETSPKEGALSKFEGSATIDGVSGIAVTYYDPYVSNFGIFLKHSSKFIMITTSEVEGVTFSPTLNAVLQTAQITR